MLGGAKFAPVGASAHHQGVMHDDHHHDHHAARPLKRLSTRVHHHQATKPPGIIKCVILILKADFYKFHHAKLHEWAGTGGEVQERLGADFQEIGLLGALMMTIAVAQFLMIFSHKPFLFPEPEAEDPLQTNFHYLMYASVLIGACIFTVLSVVFSISNIVIMNLVTDDETMIFLKHNWLGIKLPLMTLITGIILWIVASVYLAYFLVTPTYGVAISGVILVAALGVFGIMAKLLRSTFLASAILAAAHDEEPTTTPKDMDAAEETKSSMDGEADNSTGEDTHDPHAPKPLKRLSSRINHKAFAKPPHCLRCVLMILKAEFYDFHWQKLHEWSGSGAEVQGRLGSDYQNIGLLAALMMTICVAQFMMLFSHKPFLHPDFPEHPSSQPFFTARTPYALAGVGCAGPEVWIGQEYDIDKRWVGAMGQGVQACYDQVMADDRCSKDYFTYVTRGDANCGCKASGALSVRGEQKCDYYQILSIYQNVYEWSPPATSAINLPYIIYASVLMLSCIFTVVSVLLSITNMVFLNLVTDDETMIYLKYAGICVKLPLILLIAGIICWMIASIFLSYFLISVIWGIIVSSIVLCAALFAFYIMANGVQSTFKASIEVAAEHRDSQNSETSAPLKEVEDPPETQATESVMDEERAKLTEGEVKWRSTESTQL